MNNYKIFLASSNELEKEREAFIVQINKLNDNYHRQNRRIRFEIVVWERAEKAFSDTRKQEEYNRDLRTCDLFVMLYWNKVGQYTEEEFDIAYDRFLKKEGMKKVYVFKKTPPLSDHQHQESILNFERKLLQDHQQFFEQFATTEKLQLTFVEEFEKLIVNGTLRGRPADKEISDAYLDWMLECHTTLEIRGIRNHSRLQVPIEKVFVALKGDRTHPHERLQARLALERELQNLLDTGQYSVGDSQEAWWNLVAGSSVMPSLETRDRPFVMANEVAETLTLGQAYQQYSQLVILGDPGSGKTTLARWFALTMAKAMQAGQSIVEVLAHHIDPDRTVSNEQFLIGNTKLPVLVRISEYAEDRMARQKPRSLTEFLGHHTWLNSAPSYGQASGQSGPVEAEWLHDFIHSHLKANSALIILDGLDEVPASTVRDEVLGEVQAFIQRWVKVDSRVTLSKQKGQLIATVSRADGLLAQSNQLIITSRIAGYHASPLGMELPHLTIEPMGDKAVNRFCDAWMQAVHEVKYGIISTEAGLQRATQEAKALKQEIHHPKRRKIRSLASNPLLCSTLATVFHSENGHLPDQRVKLYETVVQNLTEIWQRRMAKSSAKRLKEHEIFAVLEPIAAHIHQHIPTGLLPENKLAEMATAQLALVRGGEPEQPSDDVRDTVTELVRVLREDVGLLAARGQGVYGFLHLTFQEYLAARHLVKNPDTATRELMAKIEDPRWHEPLSMALGYTSLQRPFAFSELLQDLLQYGGELVDLLPCGALLIATSLQDVDKLPDDIVEKLTDTLLMAYANRSGLGRFPDLQSVIEEAINELRQQGYERIAEETLVSHLMADAESGNGDLQGAIATILDHLNWFSPRLVQALLFALPNDSQHWHWVVDRALRKVVTPPDPEPPTIPIKPKEEAELIFYRRQLPQTLDETERLKISQQIAQFEERYRVATEDYKRHLEEYKELHKQYVVAELPVRCSIPTVNLPFRRALENQPRFVSTIIQNPDWLRLIIALYGGLQDYRIPAFMEEYHKIAAYLQLEDNERTPFEVFYKEHWTGEDTIYDMAVYLDRYGPRFQELSRKIPHFKPENIYRDSFLTPILIRALHNSQTPQMISPALHKIWQTETDCLKKAEVYIALLAIGEPIDSKQGMLPDSIDNQVLSQAIQSRLAQLNDRLKDPVARTSTHLEAGLSTIMPQLDAGHWLAVTSAAIAISIQHGGEPVNVLNFLDKLPVDDQPYLFAEHLAREAIGFGDSAVYSAAIMADLFSKQSFTPQLLIKSVALASDTQHIQLPTFQYRWPVEKFPPYTIAPDDIPITLLDNLSRIHPEISFVRDAILMRLKPILLENPELRPELMLILLGVKSQNNIREETLSDLYVNNTNQSIPWSTLIRRLVFGIKNPYYYGRALLRLAEIRTSKREPLIVQAASTIAQITDPHQRVQLLEWLVRVSPPEKSNEYLVSLLADVPHIPEPTDRARALGRLTYLLGNKKGDDLIPNLLQTIGTISDQRQQAEIVRSVLSMLQTQSNVYEQALDMAKNINIAWCRDMALQWHGSQLQGVHALLANTAAEAPYIWGPVVLAAQVQQALAVWGKTDKPETIWLQIGEDKTQLKALCRYAQQNRLRLTFVAAQVLDKLIWTDEFSNDIASLLALLENPEPETLPIIEAWCSHSNEAIAQYSALNVAELRGLTEATTPFILKLLHDKNDLPRHRAARVIHHPNISPKEPTRSLFSIGREVVTLLFEESIFQRYENPHIAVTIHWFTHDLLFDSVEIVNEWIKVLNDNGPDAYIAKGILSAIEAVTPAVWNALTAALKTGQPQVKAALFISICRLVYRERTEKDKNDNYRVIKRISDSQWEDFLSLRGELNGLTDYPILNIEPGTFVNIAKAQLRLNRPIDSDGIEQMNRQLVNHFSWSFADILQLPPYTLAETMRGVARNNLYAHKFENNQSLRQAVEEIQTDPALFQLLLSWLIERLQATEDEKIMYDSRSTHLLALILMSVEASPATFLNSPDLELLEPLLIKTARTLNSYPGRAAAIEILGYLRTINHDIIQVINTAMSDVIHVQKSAFKTAMMFRKTDRNRNILPELFKGLYSESAMVAYSTGQILAALGRSDRTQPEQRRQILQAFADAVRDPRSQRIIHFGYVDATVPEIPRLDNAYYKMMMQVSGLSK